MSLRDDIINEARKYIGTPFKHQGRLIGVGIDCVGLVVGVAKALKLFIYDNITYGRIAGPNTLLDAVKFTNMQEVPIEERQKGDVLVFYMNPRSKTPQHLAFFTGDGMIHTYERAGGVSEHSLTDKWSSKLIYVFRFSQLVGEDL